MHIDHAVAAAQKGKSDAFIRLIRHYEMNLYFIAKTILKSDILCADVMHETILKAYKHINTLKKPQHFKTWLIRILISECITTLKFEIYREPKDAAPCSYLEENKNKNVDILKIIESLECNLRIPAVLYYLEGMDINEISNLLSMQQRTVKSKLNDARMKFSESLNISFERDVNHE